MRFSHEMKQTITLGGGEGEYRSFLDTVPGYYTRGMMYLRLLNISKNVNYMGNIKYPFQKHEAEQGD